MRADRWLARIASAVLLVALPVLACGPDFPDTFLQGRRNLGRTAPRGDFAREIEAIRRSTSRAGDDAPAQEAEATVKADLSDLASYPGADRLAVPYEKARRAMMAKTPGPSLPAGLPREIELYARGAAAFHASDGSGAQARFREVLALPPKARRTKTTWATFMLGKLASDDEAVGHFREVRKLAKSGFDDRLGLARLSLSEEAKVELSREHHAAAVDLYLAAHADGDLSAVPSLQMVAAAVVRAAPPARRKALAHGPTMEIVAAYLASRNADTLGDPAFGAKKRLAAIVEALPSEGSVRGVERVAWLAYRLGDVTLAKRLLARAEPDTVVGGWLAAKLALRAGKKAIAARELAGVVTRLGAPIGGDHDVRLSPFEPESRVRGELAVLKLGRDDFEGALTLLLEAGSWRDAAHVAERVLTIEELIKVVDARFPERATTVKRDGFDTTTALRYLLARRLVRADRAATAMRYMPAEHRAALAQWIRLAHTSTKGAAAARATALSSLGRMQRHLGMELMGTELAPDWHLDGGSFDEGSTTLEAGDAVSDVERARFAASSPAVHKRFHYRFVAAETMRHAADLETGDEAAALLCVAHRWLAARDPKAARTYASELSRRKLGVVQCSSDRVDTLAEPFPVAP